MARVILGDFGSGLLAEFLAFSQAHLRPVCTSVWVFAPCTACHSIYFCVVTVLAWDLRHNPAAAAEFSDVMRLASRSPVEGDSAIWSVKDGRSSLDRSQADQEELVRRLRRNTKNFELRAKFKLRNGQLRHQIRRRASTPSTS